MHVEGAGIGGVFGLPYCAEQFFPFDHLARVLHQNLQQAHQTGGQAGLAVTIPHPAVLNIELYGTTYQQVLVFFHRQERPYAI